MTLLHSAGSNLEKSDGVFGRHAISVPTVGEFKDGRGEFYDWEEIGGRMVLARNVWKNISANSCTFEQAFSDDGGKTWEVNWLAVDTRVADQKTK